MSEKTVAQKLQIKAGYGFLLVNAPDGYEEKLGELPENVAVAKKPAGQYDVIQVFVRSRKELENHLPVSKSALKPKGILWVTYPKGTSKELKADINRESIRE